MAAKTDLVDQYGFPIQRELLTAEIAKPTIAGVRTPFSGYPADGLNPRRLASILREADQGQPLAYFELAEQIEERDLHYAGVLATRKRSVSQLEIQVDAASDSAADVANADMVRDWLKRDELQEELFDILDAVGKCVSFTEIVWDTSEGQWRPKSLAWRDPRWFRFDRVDGATPLLRVDGAEAQQLGSGVDGAMRGFDAVPLPPFKFIKTIIRAKSGLPIRSGIARLATWWWMFKAFTNRDWAIFTQTFGQPIRVGKYGAGATEKDKDTLFQAVANIAGDCAAIVPDSMMIEFIEAQAARSTDLYKTRCDWLDQQMSKAVLGQTATTDAIGGGHAVGKEHRLVQEDIERADAKVVSAVLNRDLVRCWIDLERGPQKAYPKLRIGRAEDKDVALTVESVTKLVPMGLNVSKSTMRELLGLPEPKPEDELLTAPAAAAPSATAPFNDPALQAQQRVRDALDRLAAQAEPVVQPGTDEMIDAVHAVVLAASSLDDLRTRLSHLDVPKDKLTSLLQMALAMAQLSGRAEIAEQTP